MIRRPPRSTLFPTRRSSDLPPPAGTPRRDTRRALPRQQRLAFVRREADREGCLLSTRHEDPSKTRSEEHTSELQSRLHLVCRLLLEKKKKIKKKNLQNSMMK